MYSTVFAQCYDCVEHSKLPASYITPAKYIIRFMRTPIVTMSSDDDYLTTSNNTECDRAERPVGTYKDNIQLFPEHKMARDYRRLYD